MSRFDDYFSYLSKYVILYGQQTTVLYQNGMFHEIYGVDNNEEQIGNVKVLSSLLRLPFTIVNRSAVENSRSNPLMIGFPSLIDKYKMILLQNNWTVVVVDHQKDDKGNVTRTVSNVLNLNTYIKTSNDTSISNRNEMNHQKLTRADQFYNVALLGIGCFYLALFLYFFQYCKIILI